MNKESKGIWLGLVGVVIFSMTLPATKIAVPDFGAIPLSFYRATLAGITALIYVLAKKISLPQKSDLPTLGMISILISFVFPISIAIAMQDLPSSHGGIVLGISPLLTALFATLRFGERPSRGFWITAIIGSTLVIAFSIKESGGALQLSDLALLLAAVSASNTAGIRTSSLPTWDVQTSALIRNVSRAKAKPLTRLEERREERIG